MTKKSNLRAHLATAVLISIASILHVFEGLLPPLPVPGAKLGLANIASLIGLRMLGFGSAIVISLTRCFIGALFGSGLFGPSFYLSLAGSLSSAIAMGLASKIKGIGNKNIVVSVVGALTHSTAQIVVASFLLSHQGIWWYLPYLLGLSSITGVFIGIASDKLLVYLPRAIGLEPQSKS